MSSSAAPLLEVRRLAKSYPGVAALRGVDFSAVAGEIHALVGANGAGKSTLMNLISGTVRPSDGEILLDGAAVALADPAMAQRCGIATVYQEFSLVPQLSIARNIYLSREPKGAFGLIDHDRLRREAGALLDRFSLRLDPDAEVGTLSVAEQQLVEIARALSLEARILILDEPTSVLSLAEQDNLFSIIRLLASQGMLVLYVSHFLREVLAIADRVTVLRDGQKVATRAARDLDVDGLVELMIGRQGSHARPQDARDAASGPLFAISYRAGEAESRLDMRGGEIVGLAGLVGAGRTTFARAIGGNGTRTASVRIELDGAPLDLSSPRRAMRQGVVYITEDRKRDGIFAGLDIVANASASVLGGLLRNGRRERADASAMLERLHLVAGSLAMPIAKLSGGNQQKVLIGRALLTGPRLLVCDEPTRGVDVGAKAEIHAILRQLAGRGVAVLVISSETDELCAVADRIVVMRDRRLVDEMSVEDADDAKILIAASGGPVSVEES